MSSNTPDQGPNANQGPYTNPTPSENYGNTTPQYPPNYPPQGNYGQPPNYQPQGNYGQPPNYQPQSGYGTPPPSYVPQGNYGQPPNYQPNMPTGYGAPYAPNGEPNYGNNPPPASSPLPLGEAIRQLPSQYIRVLTKPSAATFAMEKGKAAWNIVWTQLGIIILVVVLLGYAFVAISSTATLNSQNIPATTLDAIRGILGFIPLAYIILIPLGFFIGTGIYHLIAKAFGGEGKYIEYGYSYLLFYTPITIFSFLLALVPFLGGLASFALGIYALVLQIFMTMGVHRLGGGRATIAVLILPIILIVLSIVGAIVVVALIASALQRH